MSAGLTMRRAPFLALGVVALFAGLWAGLIHLGLATPTGGARLVEAHGALMVLGFLGTLISLERAVATDRSWAFAAPAAAGTGALLTATRAPADLGPALLALAGAILVAEHVLLDRRQRSARNAVMGFGALAWLTAAVWWLTGAGIGRLVPLLAGFLVLTIVGERLELSRLRQPGRAAPLLLLAAVAALVAGLGVSIATADAGLRIAGGALLAQAAWLARYDVARRTVRVRGVTRFMALALLTGYVWLGTAGALWLAHGADGNGQAYDAAVHALFVGFVMSMVFAHAPVIVPAVLRVRLPFHPVFYVHLALLHASLAVRLLLGDAAGIREAWQWGSALNGVAILLFVGASAAAVLHARRPRPSSAPADFLHRRDAASPPVQR